MSRLLLVDGCRELAGMLYNHFERLGMVIDYADNGELGLKLASENEFDIIILNLNLPRISGLTLCHKIRKSGNETPILILTSNISHIDMLKAFENGADDYLTQPFDLDILSARVNAIIRRYNRKSTSYYLGYGEVSINLKEHKAYRNDKLLALKPTSYNILEALIKFAPAVISYEKISFILWGDKEPNNDTLRSHIYQLRAQLDKPFEHDVLITVPKVGYRLSK
ncbi:response regulator transcription factor [Vibrio alginolyticus]|uniref:response regulator transcription factor n=1 Tax=Vibrio alginolyticus TaxID=663 RepID=UPI001BD1CAB2|nr:response regulator transcription factor [Vibrio alginolyticus]MBT0114194.1 response regulator transcription factor [Vibrio alginolyticus]MCZ2802729.1 response regulator transcription factor [Vibrio alginolyticus]